MPEVEWVEPNRRERRLQGPPTDPLYANQWWLQPVAGTNAQVLDARRRGVAGFQTTWARSGVPTAPTVVAVLDTGITAHDDLVGRVLPGFDFVSGVEYANDGDGRDADPLDPGDYFTTADLANPAFDGCQAEDSSWHGTIVTGMVAAQADNGIGGAGIHASAKILPVRVAGKCGAEVADIVDGMRWAAGLAVAGAPANPTPARVVSISFGGSAACGPAYQAAVDELRAAGVVVVAAAGNEWGAPSRPANCTGVVGVVGLNRDGFKTNYSNFGSVLGATGIAAPSGDDADGAWGSVLADTGLTTLTNAGRTAPLGTNSYASLFGTSFAVPQVSGTVALMLALNPRLTVAQILDGLRKSARPHVTSPKIGQCSDTNPGRCICTTATCGAGILDAEQALLYAAAPTTYVAPARQPAVIDNVDVDRALALAPQDRLSQAVVVAGSGGGAFGLPALLGLGLAVAALRRPRRLCAARR
jgi:serine protease